MVKWFTRRTHSNSHYRMGICLLPSSTDYQRSYCCYWELRILFHLLIVAAECPVILVLIYSFRSPTDIIVSPYLYFLNSVNHNGTNLLRHVYRCSICGNPHMHKTVRASTNSFTIPISTHGFCECICVCDKKLYNFGHCDNKLHCCIHICYYN